jgi:hypothetical protein
MILNKPIYIQNKISVACGCKTYLESEWSSSEKKQEAGRKQEGAVSSECVVEGAIEPPVIFFVQWYRSGVCLGCWLVGVVVGIWEYSCYELVIG